MAAPAPTTAAASTPAVSQPATLTAPVAIPEVPVAGTISGPTTNLTTSPVINPSSREKGKHKSQEKRKQSDSVLLPNVSINNFRLET